MAILNLSFFDINGDPQNEYAAHSKGSKYGFTLRFKAYQNSSEVPFTPTYVEVGEDSESMAGITSHGPGEQFESYPYRFDSSDLAGMMSGNSLKSLALPYGTAPDLKKESISVPDIAVDASNPGAGTVGGEYILLTVEEASAAIEEEIASYTGYNKIYRCEFGGSYRYIRAHGTDAYNRRWCISDTAKDVSTSSSEIRQYIIKAATRTPSYNSREAFPDDPAAELSMYIRSDGDDMYMPGEEVVHTDDSFIKNKAASEHLYEKTFYVRMGDGTNSTDVMPVTVQTWMNAPEDISIMLTGSSGNGNYTGFRRKDNRFFPSLYVKATVSASSDIPIKFRLTGASIDVNRVGSIGKTSWIKLSSKMQRTVAVKLVPPDTFMSTYFTSNIMVVVEDDAGNSNCTDSDPSTAIQSNNNDSIQVLTKLFRTAHENLVEETPSEKYRVYTATGANLTLIQQTVVSTDPDDYTRSWNEIWYPDTHGAPLKDDGTIDVEKATRISKPTTDSNGINGPTPSELLQYDRLAMNDDYSALLTDDDGRYFTTAADWSNSKTYPGMVNSRLSDGVFKTYWIIDNTGNPDFRLEFEYFDFSGDVTSLPSNLVAPYDGDMLCVYDASDPLAVNVAYDSDGNEKYTLNDSSRLVRLFTLKGSYNPNSSNPITMVDSAIPGALTMSDCGFITPSITSCSRICLVPFTDYGDTGSSVGSGFKLKAGPKHMATRENFEYSSQTGEFWIHLSPQTSASGNWSTAGEIAIDYKYYDSFATTDCEAGTVSLDTRIDYPLLATFNVFLYLDTDGTCRVPYGRFSPYYSPLSQDGNMDIYGNPHCIRTFATTEDDYVDYLDPAFYVEPTGLEMDTSIYDGKTAMAGKIVNGYSCNKDTGILTIDNTSINLNDDVPPVPLGRLFGKYSYHTFYRLTSDGYGDLHFYGTGILVPATVSNNYTDWAYVDLRVVNEGTNTLHDGLLQFLARGYITKSTVVDTVLDNNRPWDVQEGTTAETVQRTGGRVATSHNALKSGQFTKATRTNAFNARASQSVVLGTIDPKGMVYVRVFWCIANNADGTAWIDVTRGKKVFSAELAGRFYLFSN